MTAIILCATAAEVFTYIGYVIVALLALMVMIVIHESGHYLAGKLLGFKIDEFAIGFGPKIISKTSKKTGEVFSIRPIPLGGFCAFHGEDEDGGEDALAFNNQKPWKRLIVLFSGAAFNFLSAILIISIYFSVYGQILPVVQNINPTGNAYADGTFQEGDVILSVDGKTVNILLAEDLTRCFADCGDTATFRVLRAKYDDNGEKIGSGVVVITATKGDYTYEKTLYDDAGNATGTETVSAYGFGISWAAGQVELNFFRALGRSFSFCFFAVFKILASIGALITGKLSLSNAGGTITTIKVIAETSQAGFQYLLYAVAILSANLAVMNLLPFPALDGSRMVFTLIEMIFRKPVPRKVEAIIHAVGFVILIVFAVFLDVFHLVTN